MRDPARIKRILAKLETLWLMVPDQRLLQLIANLDRRAGWHTEDDLTEEKIDEQLAHFRAMGHREI